MRILLVGEYSRLHNSLKEGLQQLGHEVAILGFSDGFKDFPIDFKLEKKWRSGWRQKIRGVIYKTTSFDLASWLTYNDFLKIKSKFTNYDIVQLINENSFYCEPHYEKKILQFLFAHNKKVFLLSCGDDYLNVTYSFAHPEIKSVVQPFLMGKIRKCDFTGVLQFRKNSFRKLHEYIYSNISGVIASDLDYHVPLLGNPKYLGMIPNPINTDDIAFQPLSITGKIKIFLGINTESYHKKGMDYFEQALAEISKKYPDQVEVDVSRSIPYEQYISLYDQSHILLDQAFAHDQGYNALEAMAKGKVVFTGAGQRFSEYYRLNETVAINAEPDAKQIAVALEELIAHPEKIPAIGLNARKFIEAHHDYRLVAIKYLNVWTEANSATN